MTHPPRRPATMLLLAALTAAVCAARFFAADQALRVNEAATRANFDGEQPRIMLAVENRAGQPTAARVKLELLDPQGRAVFHAERDTTLRPGASALDFTLARAALKPDESLKELLWHRLRYRVTPAPTEGDQKPTAIEGLVSVSEITPELFELQVFAPDVARAGSRFQTRARAAHPITGRPVSGVRVAGRVGDDDRHAVKAEGLTDADGYAVLTFDLPRVIEESDLEIKFTAARGSLRRAAEVDGITVDSMARVLLSTDKPLYQPGQTLHVRALVFDPAHRAVADAEAELTVTDHENQTVFRAPLKTSRFGVASADWQIPANTRLGSYRVEVELDDAQESSAATEIKISRYDLPTFAVNVKPDRGYYLPGQNAEVEVRADYLFGQPVTKGKVKVVREAERTWNYREQKYDVEEGEKYEGEVDAAGRFVARVDLAEAHEELRDNGYRRFEDVRYAAYFTDATTGRTEQRRFDLRVTRDEIHLYFIDGGEQSADFPLEFYVSASYADGSPAPCDVTISEIPQPHAAPGAGGGEVTRRTVRTNRYGVAKVSSLTLPRGDEQSDDRTLGFLARDAEGRTGRHTETMSLPASPVVRVSTDKALYRAGEPIKATIHSNVPHARLVVEAVHDGRVVASHVVTLQSGQAQVTVPYRPEFKNEVTVTAYGSLVDEDGEQQAISGSRTALYPHNRELKLDARTARGEYQPGDEVVAELRAAKNDGRPVAAVFGAVVVDRAVEERARTDREFRGGGFYGPYFDFYYGGGSLAGLTRKDLEQLDPARPAPEGLELVAEILLRDAGRRVVSVGGDEYDKDQRGIFSAHTEAQFKPLRDALDLLYSQRGVYPTDRAALLRLLAPAGINPEELRDPWGQPYRVEFSTVNERDEMRAVCAGADKRFETADDFTVLSVARAYFRFVGEAVNRAVARHRAQTGDYVRDAAALKATLLAEGVNFDVLRDPWGGAYRMAFGRNGTLFNAVVESAGPNGRFEARGAADSDDFAVWAAPIDFTSDLEARLRAALDAHFRATSRFPMSEAELREAAARAGLDLDAARDPWGNSYYAVFTSHPTYADRVIVQSYATYGQQAQPRTTVRPVTRWHHVITLRSVSEDGQRWSADDFDALSFRRVVDDQAIQEAVGQPSPPAPSVILPGSTGAIRGVVTDASGAVVPNATIKAARKVVPLTFETRSDTEGRYLLKNLPAGSYEVRFDATGFKALLIGDVPVNSSSVTELNATVDVGTVSETVMVTASAAVMQTESSAVGTVTGRTINNLPLNGRNFQPLAMLAPGAVVQSGDISTPRLREHFPETLVWRPAIETDARGRAQLKFKLADNITTWKLALVASTADGQIGMAEREIRSFLPFFAELDPPKVLTEGDEISLPVVLRNYLDARQSVDLQMKPESWFAPLGPFRKRAEVGPNDSARETFDFRAVTSITDGKQRVTALGSTVSDAIEKTVSVHPDGEEIAQTAAQVFGETGALEVVVPGDAIKGTPRAELKIYPNLMAHVLEGIEGILRRPYGCGEQTISSTYPNVMALRYVKSLGPSQSEAVAAISARARKYAVAGYERLLGYRAAGGGFTYWGRGEADFALTAYALRFLADAGEVIPVDEAVVAETRDWLIKQQQADGRWLPHSYWSRDEDLRASTLRTAQIARSLARLKGGAKSDQPSAAHTALSRALDFLAKQTAVYDEPYAIASYALAAMDAGERERAAWAVEKLRSLARDEAGGAYWNLETNTPFYGWGTAGRVETSALALKALALGGEARDRELIGRATYFLMRNKDRYGVWLSTQATINVLDALITLFEREGAQAAQAGAAEIFVNGRRVSAVTLPPSNQLSNPITVDLSAYLAAGRNRVEIKRAAGAALSTAQLVETHYVPWPKSAATSGENFRPGESRALRLAVRFDRTEAKIGEEITCRVEAERVGFSGYGMMLAEVGLPPGAEVKRESLEKAVKEAGWGVSQYDVLPDRVILYLWPRAGGTRVEFKFKPRFGVKALSAASVLYDYYNPEARAVVAPAKFVVR
jgi:uncharacterized protein YfaS (alpha-2-macroglobulin family)